VATGLTCRSGQIFGCAKGFCPNLPEKNSEKDNLPKENDCISFWAHFFHIKAHQTPFCPNFPQKNYKKMTSKNTLHFDFVRYFFLNQSASSDSATVFTHFARILRDIARGFSRNQTFGGALAPPPPTPVVFLLASSQQYNPFVCVPTANGIDLLLLHIAAFVFP